MTACMAVLVKTSSLRFALRATIAVELVVEAPPDPPRSRRRGLIRQPRETASEFEACWSEGFC